MRSDLQAASLRIAEQYMQAFSKIAKEVNIFFYFYLTFYMEF